MYTEPKVTIDLAEYNELLALKEVKSDPTGEIAMYKEVIAVVLSCVSGFKESPRDLLGLKGISFSVREGITSRPGEYIASNISVSKLQS